MILLVFRVRRRYRIVMTYLAVPVAADNCEEAVQQVEAADAAGAEIIELRIDYLENLSVEMLKRLVAEVKSKEPVLPVIVTCRDVRQGGARAYPEHLRIELLTAALRCGADFIDVEYENFIPPENREKIITALSKSLKGRLILSAHNFEARFDDIRKLHRQMLAMFPAAIPKLVYIAKHINDCFEAFDLLHAAGGDTIAFCMGAAGLISRIIAKKLGSFLTFASIDERNATAPGQLTVEQLRRLYRYDSINRETELYGVIGSPIGHSLSPAVHNACFGETGADKLYLPLLVEGARGEFDGLLNNILRRGWLDFGGFSVTIPHKQNALRFTAAGGGVVEPLAEKIGAVNTLLIGPNNKLNAYNTDYAGALDAITEKLAITRADLKDVTVAVVGAGGVARAIVAGLSDVGAKITIYNRTVERARTLAAEFNCTFACLGDLTGLAAKLVINCTSIGMYPNVDASCVPYESIKRSMTIFDTVYNPAKTQLLTDARKKRAKTIDGLAMFVNQALAQFKLFTGQNGNPKLMRKIISGCLSQQ